MDRRLIMLAFFLIAATVATPATGDDPMIIRQVIDKSSSEDDHAKHEFSMFKSKFNKSYANQEEEDYRFGVFKKHLEFIEKINKAANKYYKLGIEEFSDLTSEERQTTRCGRSKPLPTPTLLECFLHNLNLVLPIFDEGINGIFCGSAYDHIKNQIILLKIKSRPLLLRLPRDAVSICPGSTDDYKKPSLCFCFCFVKNFFN